MVTVGRAVSVLFFRRHRNMQSVPVGYINTNFLLRSLLFTKFKLFGLVDDDSMKLNCAIS